MKPNCKDCGKVDCAWNGSNMEKYNSKCFVSKAASISTPALIEELERRRPECARCNSDKLCMSCVWDIKGFGEDNFKEAK